jgi:hypothetical protein
MARIFGNLWGLDKYLPWGPGLTTKDFPQFRYTPPPTPPSPYFFFPRPEELPQLKLPEAQSAAAEYIKGLEQAIGYKGIPDYREQARQAVSSQFDITQARELAKARQLAQQRFGGGMTAALPVTENQLAADIAAKRGAALTDLEKEYAALALQERGIRGKEGLEAAQLAQQRAAQQYQASLLPFQYRKELGELEYATQYLLPYQQELAAAQQAALANYLAGLGTLTARRAREQGVRDLISQILGFGGGYFLGSQT